MIALSETFEAAIAAKKPQRFLLEFKNDGSYANPVVFSNEEIAINKGVRLSASVNPEEELTIGACPSAQLDFALLNDQRQISDFEFGECKAWLGVRIDSGTPEMKTRTFTEDGKTVTYEFAPLGIFIAERPKVVQKDIIDITASDRMSLFEKELPDDTTLGVTYPITIGSLAQKLCAHVGVTLATPNFLNNGITIAEKRPKQFEERTMREILKWIAEAAGSFAVFNRSGELEIRWFRVTNAVYDETRYKEVTQTWYKPAAITGLKVRNQEETSEHSYGTDTNPYVIVGNPFLR